jgi:4,5-dihydroxyphthalate decarboxylase
MKSGKGLFPLTLAMGDYDRTRPLLDGRVRPEGIALKAISAAIPEFCLKPVYEEYDVAEMSLSWYLMAHSRQEPVIALPVFPLRMPVHAYIYTRSDATYTSPKEFVGKRIGTKRYRSTINVWLRGILKEYYGIDPRDFAWITPAEEGAGFVVPAGVSVAVRPGEMKDIEELLFKGEIEAIFTPVTPDAVKRGDPRIRRLFPECKAVCEAYFRLAGFLPITHTIVMNKLLYEKEPWIAERLFRAFQEAQRLCLEFYTADPKHLTFSGTTFFLEEERRVYGNDPWAHGLAANRAALTTFARYACEQGYISRIPSLEELFAGNTLFL